MSRSIKCYKDGTYRIWSNIADGYLTERITREEAVKWLSEDVLQKANDEIEEIVVSFPHGYRNKEGNMIIDEKRQQDLQNLMKQRIERYRSSHI